MGEEVGGLSLPGVVPGRVQGVSLVLSADGVPHRPDRYEEEEWAGIGSGDP